MKNNGGTSYDYGFRIYDSRLGRFLSVDPLTKEYPWYTPYQFAGNKPIWAVDLDGKEEFFVTDFRDANRNLYKTTITVVSTKGVQYDQQTVHRSEVSFDNSGNATVTYKGSKQGTTTGKNAFASNRERQFALGKDNTGKDLLLPIAPKNVVTTTTNVGSGLTTRTMGVATQISYSPTTPFGENNYLKEYYDANGRPLGIENETLANYVTMDSKTDPNIYKGTDPNSSISNNLRVDENAVPINKEDRTNALGLEADKYTTNKPQGNSGRTISATKDEKNN